MSVITIDEAKLHQRIDNDDEDSDIQSKLDAAESMVAQFIGRYFYKDSVELDNSAEQISEFKIETDKRLEKLKSLINDKDTYLKAKQNLTLEVEKQTSMIACGIVMNEQIRSSVLLTFGYLYAMREDVGDLPQAAKDVAQPFRINLGV